MRQPQTSELEVPEVVANDLLAAPRPPRWRSRRTLIASLVVVGLAIPLGGYVVWGWLREDATPVSLGEARTRFRDEHPDVAQGAGPLRPAEGVYEYIGSGSDHISVPPLTQQHGPRMPGTVTHAAEGCWTFRIDFSSNHWQDWTYCPTANGLDELGGHTFQRWDLGLDSIENRSDFTCTSRTLKVDMQPGDEWTQTCKGRNNSIAGVTTSRGPMRFVGVETITVGGEPTVAFHLHQQRTVTGGQRGRLEADVWFAPSGLPLRERHTVNVATSSPIGDIDYDESTDFTLTSLQPRT